MTIAEFAREIKGRPRFDGGASVHDLLMVLGFRPHERVSINTRLPGERFKSTLYGVGELEEWSPPLDRDVWVAVNPIGAQVKYGRGTEADVARVRSLFADFDVKPGQFNGLSQCYDAKYALDTMLGVGFVAFTETGHGLQPFWRVGSPPGDSNVVDRDRERLEWKTIYQRWGAVVQNAARLVTESAEPNVVDNVYDLSRVLRCPGSVNWKDPNDPVPVRTSVLGGRRVLPRHLVAMLDRDNIAPLARVGPVCAHMPTNYGEAEAWVNAQPGALLDLDELLALSPERALGAYLDLTRLVQLFAYPDGSMYKLMIQKVQHAVYSAQEGRAGLGLALDNIRTAYLEVMRARERGKVAGEARSEPVAADEFRRAVVGAVARARGRGQPVMPDLSAWRPRAMRPAEPSRPKIGRR